MDHQRRSDGGSIRKFSPDKLEQLRRRARLAPDPMQLVTLFRPLRIRSGYTLRADLLVSGADSRSVVYAASDTDPKDLRFTRYIDGPATPRSYLLASVLTRELLEFGAIRHGCWWRQEVIVAASVVKSEIGVVVDFSTTAADRFTQYKDTYQPGQYTFQTEGTISTTSDVWKPRRSS